MLSDCKNKYSEILGKVGKGVHSYRIFNIAIVDVIATILLAYIINNIIKFFYSKSLFIYILIILFILGIILHRLFCVDTTINKFIFN